MKKYLYISLLCPWLLLSTSCDKYNDDRIWQDLNELGGDIASYEALAQSLNEQMSQVKTLMNSAYITFISTDAAGNYVISYADAAGNEHTMTVATAGDTMKLPVITARQDSDGKYYWASTTDNGKTYTFITDGNGAKFPIGGTMPQLSIDDQGFWSIEGKSTGVMAFDLSGLLFQNAYIDQDNGEAVFVLADGTELRMTVKEALGLNLDCSLFSGVVDYATPVTIGYNVYGAQASSATVDLFTAYNMEVTIDRRTSTLIAKMKEGATDGNILVLAHAGNHTLLKPLYFTYGEAVIAEPTYNGSNIMGLNGNAQKPELQVSASIAYDVQVSADWIAYTGSRAMVTTTHTFDVKANDTGEERKATITFANSLYNISTVFNVIQDAKEEDAKGGIASASDLKNFAKAVNAGGSLARWQNADGEVVLLNDIDMADAGEWVPIGSIDNGGYSSAAPYKTVNPFRGVFDGKGFAIKHVNGSVDLTGRVFYGLFGAVEDATIKNLVLGDPAGTDTWTLTGVASKQSSYAAIASFATNSTITNCTSYVNIDFQAENKQAELCVVSGIVGTIVKSTVGGAAKADGCFNRGNVRVGAITNKANGATGMQTSGICGVMSKCDGNKVAYCVNYGDISCPSGREGGIVGTIFMGNILCCDNRGVVEDDLVGQHASVEPAISVTYKRIGGIFGGSDDLKAKPENTVEECTNYGVVMSHMCARTGGIAGHSNIAIIGCANKGAVLADLFIEANGTNRHGPGWLCGYSGATSATWTNAKSCVCGGQVGDYTTYKNDPMSAPDATNENAFCHNPGGFDATINY